MNYGIVAILDRDTKYSQALASYLRLKCGLSFDISIFTSPDSLVEGMAKKNADILIISSDFYEKVPPDIYQHTGSTFVLSDDRNGLSYSSENIHSIFRFSSAREIMQQIMTIYSPQKDLQCESNVPLSSLIGVYSPLGRCGKTSFALSLAINLSRRDTCLFVTLDSSCGLSLFDLTSHSSEGRNSLENLLYFFLQSKELSESRLMSAVASLQTLDFIIPTTSPSNIYEITDRQWSDFFLKISALGKYKYIVADFGCNHVINDCLKNCNYLFMPTLDSDSYCALKLKLEKRDLSHFHKIKVPNVNVPSGCLDYTLELTAGTLGQFTSQIIGNLNI